MLVFSHFSHHLVARDQFYWAIVYLFIRLIYQASFPGSTQKTRHHPGDGSVAGSPGPRAIINYL